MYGEGLMMRKARYRSRGSWRCLKALGQHHLDHVSGGDIFLGPHHHGLEVLPGNVGTERSRRLWEGGQAPWHRLSQALDEDLDGLQRPLVLGLQGNLRVQAHQAHNLDGLAQVVKNQEIVG
jgi:hypothetical protein